MQVEFQYDEAEIALVLRRLAPAWKRLWSRISPVVFLYLAALPGLLLCIAAEAYFALTVVATSVTLIALQVLRITLFSQDPAPARPMPIAPIRLRLHASYLESISTFDCARWDWSLVERLDATPDYLMLQMVGRKFYPVPRRAFASPADADRFLELAHTYRERANPSEDRFPQELPLPVADPQASADGCLSVRFQNTLDEFVRVHFEGFDARPRHDRPILFASAVVIAGCLGIAWTLRDADPMLRNVVLGIAAGVLTGVLLGVFRFLQRWFQRRELRRHQRFPETTLSIGPLGIGYWDSLSSYCSHDWSTIQRVHRSSRYLGVMSNKQTVAHLVPLDAFSSAEEADRFAKLAEAYRQQASPRADNATPARESGNPYQPPQA